MAFQPVVNVAQVEVLQSQQDEAVENVLYFKSDGAITGASLNLLSQAVFEHWETFMMPLKHSTTFLLGVVAKDLTTQVAATGQWGTGSFIGGSVSGDPCPNNVSLSVSFRTGLSGRGSRGRNYWTGLAENQVNGNQVSGALVTSIANAYFAMIGIDTMAAGWTWGIVSRYLNNTKRSAGVWLATSSILVIDPIVDSMRRRLPKRGS